MNDYGTYTNACQDATFPDNRKPAVGIAILLVSAAVMYGILAWALWG